MSNVMEETGKAIEIGFEKIKEVMGEDYKLENGDTFVCEGKNFCLIIGLEDNKIRTEFVGGKALKLDVALSFYEDE